MWRALPLFLLLACGNKNNPQPADAQDGPAEDAAPADGVEDGAPEGEEPAENPDASEKPTPQSLYDECKGRVEGPTKEGECTTDADCATAGCGNEVCLPKADAGNVMTTCEDRLCFKILDTCGCTEGQCSWALKAEVPEMTNTPKLPPNRLPPSPPPEDAPEEPAPEDGAKE